jgi:hypothetical protein
MPLRPRNSRHHTIVGENSNMKVAVGWIHGDFEKRLRRGSKSFSLGIGRNMFEISKIKYEGQRPM